MGEPMAEWTLEIVDKQPTTSQNTDSLPRLDVDDPPFPWHQASWLAVPLYMLLVVPMWVSFMSWSGRPADLFSSATGCLLFGCIMASAYTDLRWRLIPNWITYPTILAGLAINGFDSLTGYAYQTTLGSVGFTASLLGLFGLFSTMLIIFSFSGGGAGDVKLAGAIGVMLGFVHGGEAILLSFVVCAVLAIGWALWKIGPLTVVSSVFRGFGSYWLPRLICKPSEEQAKLLKTGMPMAPFFAIGTSAVMLRESLIVDPTSLLQLFFG